MCQKWNGERDSNKWYQFLILTSIIYLNSTNNTITKMMMTIAKMARTPLKVAMMLPQFADGLMSSAVVDTQRPGVSGDVVRMLEPLVTMIPTRSHHMHWLSQ